MSWVTLFMLYLVILWALEDSDKKNNISSEEQEEYDRLSEGILPDEEDEDIA